MTPKGTSPASANPWPDKAGPPVRIKICGLTREQDVDAAVAAGADAIGLVLYAPSPRHVTAERAAELAGRLPPLVTPVLLFVNASASEIERACAPIRGSVLQFHGDETADFCAAISQRLNKPFWRAARIPAAAPGSGFDLLEFATAYAAAQALLLDAEVSGYGGGGTRFDWLALPPRIPAHLVLSGGLTPGNVGAGIRALRGRGRSLTVDVSSGVEACGPAGEHLKGVKDGRKIRQFVAAVRAADPSDA